MVSAANPGAMLSAFGDVWALLHPPGNPTLLRLDARGRVKARLELDRIVGAEWLDDLAADGDGVWLAAKADEPANGTGAIGACESRPRTGPDREGRWFVVRIDAGSSCPATFVELGTEPPSGGGILPTASPQPGAERAPADIDAAGGFVWAATDAGLVRVDPTSGDVRTLDVEARVIGVGLDGVWAGGESAVRRVRPSDGEVLRTYQLDAPARHFTFGFGSAWVTTAGERGAVHRLDPNREGGVSQRIELDGGAGVLGIAAGTVFVAEPDGRRLSAIDPRTNALRGTPRTLAGAVTALSPVGESLWLALSGSGIWRIENPR